jgi:hypothetical protein
MNRLLMCALSLSVVKVWGMDFPQQGPRNGEKSPSALRRVILEHTSLQNLNPNAEGHNLPPLNNRLRTPTRGTRTKNNKNSPQEKLFVKNASQMSGRGPNKGNDV